VLGELRAVARRGEPIIAAGVGLGLTARSALQGGADLIVAYHSAPFRLAGVPSLAGLMPFSNANAMVRELAPPLLAAMPGAPALATACAADPFLDHDTLLLGLQQLGFAGVLNAPTATLLDGDHRRQLEEAGMGFASELELIRSARRLDLVSCAYITTPDEAAACAAGGADLLIAHLGITRTTPSALAELDAAAHRLTAIHEAARASAPGCLLLCHGGPIATPAALQHILDRAHGVDGYFGAAALEQEPIRHAVHDATAAFKRTRIPGRADARR